MPPLAGPSSFRRKFSAEARTTPPTDSTSARHGGSSTPEPHGNSSSPISRPNPMKKILGILASLALASIAFGQASVTRGGATGLAVQQANLVFTTPVIGVASGTSLTLSSLTAGRVPIVSTAGLISD